MENPCQIAWCVALSQPTRTVCTVHAVDRTIHPSMRTRVQVNRRSLTPWDDEDPWYVDDDNRALHAENKDNR